MELAPWQEQAHQSLMRLLALNGQRGSALAQYEACRRALREELDVESGEETRRLYERIRDGELGPPRQEAAPIRGSARDREQPPFVDLRETGNSPHSGISERQGHEMLLLLQHRRVRSRSHRLRNHHSPRLPANAQFLLRASDGSSRSCMPT